MEEESFDLSKAYEKVDILTQSICLRGFVINDPENDYLNQIVHLPDYTTIEDKDNPFSFLNEEVKLVFTIEDEGLSKVANSNNLHKAFHKYVSGKGLLKKESIQRYRANEIRNIIYVKRGIYKGIYKPDKAHEFVLSESGHTRYIKSSSPRDQIVQRSLNDNLLVPVTKPFIIYDNDASLKGRGISLQRKRFKIHLQRASREYKKENDEGYILSMDFSKYFDNIIHDKALNLFAKFLTDKQLKLVSCLFSEFEIDVSYMDEDEYLLCESLLFNSLEYNDKIHNNEEIKSKLDKSKILKKSMGIGNQLSQITGVYYPTPMDNYCKIKKGIKFYGRYMDDSYAIVKTKDEAKQLLKELIDISSEVGVHINLKKTKINSIYNQNTFLKINYIITDTGKIIEKPVSATFRREMKRLRMFKKLMNEGRMTFDQILLCYKSWRGSYSKYDCGLKIKALDDEMRSLFHLPYNYDFSLRKDRIRKINFLDKAKSIN